MKTKPPSKTSEPYRFGQVVVAPFPFSDSARAKRRPLVIITPASMLGAQPLQHLCAMITSTSTRWKSDVRITGIEAAGLNVPCHIRLKLFTLDERLLLETIGQLATKDARALKAKLREVVG